MTKHSGNFIEQVQAQIEALEAERSVLREQMRPLEFKLAAIDQQLNALRSYLMPPAPTVYDGSDGLTRRIATVLRNASYGMTPTAIAQKVTEDGGPAVRQQAVQQAIYRHSELFQKVQRGVYILREKES